MSSNEKESVCYAQPRTQEDRVAIARDFTQRFDYHIPMLVDRMTNDADQVYAGWPERLYVIGVDGRVAYKGQVGPFGYDPEELDAWLSAHL